MNYIKYKESFFNILDNCVLCDFVERAAECPFDSNRECIKENTICSQVKKEEDIYYCAIARQIAELCKIAKDSSYIPIEDGCCEDTCCDCELRACSECLHEDEEVEDRRLSCYPQLNNNPNYRDL